MNAEMLMDAINLLPDDILEQVDALRQRRHIPWKSLTALAACLCLVAGLWLFPPVGKSAQNMESAGASCIEDGSMHTLTEAEDPLFPADAPDLQTVTDHPFCQAEYVDVTVVGIYDGMIGVVKGWQTDHTIDGLGELISLAYMQQPLTLSPGDHLRIWFGDPLQGYRDTTVSLGEMVLIPERIEIRNTQPE